MPQEEREKSAAKVARFLTSRGYDMDIIRKVLKGFL
jgi:SOS response regulatory protein OraA/RecX